MHTLTVFWFVRFAFLVVLVCLSIDVTGALVLRPTQVFFWDIFITVAFRTCVSVHRRDRCTRTSFNQGFFVDIFATVAFRTCVSAHRRDRCTRTLLNQGLVFDLFTTVAFVLVCLSIRDRCTSTLSYQGSVTASFTKAAFRTCVSVHRRDRCTRTLPNLHSTVSGILLP